MARKNPFYLEGRKVKVGVAEGKHVEGPSQQPLSTQEPLCTKPAPPRWAQRQLGILLSTARQEATADLELPCAVKSLPIPDLLGQLSPDSGTVKVNGEAAWENRY